VLLTALRRGYWLGPNRAVLNSRLVELERKRCAFLTFRIIVQTWRLICLEIAGLP
jgi:hypothetical protein